MINDVYFKAIDELLLSTITRFKETKGDEQFNTLVKKYGL